MSRTNGQWKAGGRKESMAEAENVTIKLSINPMWHFQIEQLHGHLMRAIDDTLLTDEEAMDIFATESTSLLKQYLEYATA